MEENDKSNQPASLPENNKDDEEEKKKNKKRMFIIIGIAVALVIILIIVLVLLLTFCRNQDLKGKDTTEITQVSDETSVPSITVTESTEKTETTSNTSSTTTDTTEEATTETEESTEEEVTESPTINLAIVEGPTFSPADEVCFYRIKATVTGVPEPDIVWSIDDSLGAFLAENKVQVNINDPGETRTLVATATNIVDSATDSITISWGCNRPPEIQEITLMGDHFTDTEYTVSAFAVDPDGDTLAYNWSVSGGSVYDEDVNPMEWTTPGTPGFYDITVNVDDGKGGTDTMTESVEVREPNRPPVVGPITITELKTGSIPIYIYTNHDYKIYVEATDPDGDALLYNWTATGGSITKGEQNPAGWKAPSSQGYYTISVTVSDGKGGTASNGIYVYVRAFLY